MGKPKCTTELVQTAVRLKKAGATNKDIAAALCIAESTFYEWLGNPKTPNQSELLESLKKAEGEFKTSLVNNIIKAGKEKDWKAHAWLLERRYPDEYGRKEPTTQTAAEGAQGASVPAFYFDREKVR